MQNPELMVGSCSVKALGGFMTLQSVNDQEEPGCVATEEQGKREELLLSLGMQVGACTSGPEVRVVLPTPGAQGSDEALGASSGSVQA